jgi:ubiquinone/menaquinone biosynthesis C-methylase UbiE
MSKPKSYIPPLRYDCLTGLFDPVLKLTMPEKKFKQALLRQADIEFKPDLTILDFGCGTATLTLMARERWLGEWTKVVGVDVDEKALAIAQKKAQQKKLDIDLIQYNGNTLPFLGGTVDCVLSSLVFHHLTPAQKGKALSEIYRVLKKGGQLHIADWGKAQNTLMRSAFYLVQLLDGFETTTDNVLGLLPAYIENAGFEQVTQTKQYATVFGTLALYKACKIN